jgi:predicted DNA-binding protein (UPF0251 family)
MARPTKKRRIRCNPAAYYFKPRGIPLYQLQEVVMKSDKLETIRLADLEGFAHKEASVKMKISRATFGRIVKKAQNKLADAVLNGKAVMISEDEFLK